MGLVIVIIELDKSLHVAEIRVQFGLIGKW